MKTTGRTLRLAPREETSETKGPVYDPSKKYTWDVNSDFVIKGSEFGFVLNTIRQELNSPEAQRIMRLQKANEVIERIMKENVESGVIKESQ